MSHRRNERLTQHEYDLQLISQGNGCWICKAPEPEGQHLCTDHSHYSNADRGLLCHRCNKVLGLMKDDPELLFRMILYLREYDRARFVNPTIPEKDLIGVPLTSTVHTEGMAPQEDPVQ